MSGSRTWIKGFLSSLGCPGPSPPPGTRAPWGVLLPGAALHPAQPRGTLSAAFFRDLCGGDAKAPSHAAPRGTGAPSARLHPWSCRWYLKLFSIPHHYPRASELHQGSSCKSFPLPEPHKHRLIWGMDTHTAPWD